MCLWGNLFKEVFFPPPKESLFYLYSLFKKKSMQGSLCGKQVPLSGLSKCYNFSTCKLWKWNPMEMMGPQNLPEIKA